MKTYRMLGVNPIKVGNGRYICPLGYQDTLERLIDGAEECETFEADLDPATEAFLTEVGAIAAEAPAPPPVMHEEEE